MAIPPEPIDEIMPLVDAVVLAEVVDVIERGPQAPIPQPTLPDEVDLPCVLAYQIVTLRVSEVLAGSLAPAPDELLTVRKPAGDYTLRSGNKGPFLLQNPGPHNPHPEPVIIGRYGPDSYRLEVLKEAVPRHFP